MFTLPDLPYSYEALEPYFDTLTMEIHHQKHHAAYTNNLNAAIKGTDLENKPIDEILKHVSKYPEAVRNNAGGFYNHNFFWSILSPTGASTPSETSAIYMAIAESFGSFDAFKMAFKQEALACFGSGWAWLCFEVPGEDLYVSSTPNQDNPLMDVVGYYDPPLLGLDVWEHAYYLTYQNRRDEYIDAFFQVINWEEVNAHYLALKE